MKRIMGIRYGREAPLYQIAAHLKPETIIVLDDAGREPEQRAIANWRRVWPDGLEVEYFPGHKGLAVIQVREPSKMVSYPFRLPEIWQNWFEVQKGLKKDGNKISPFYSVIYSSHSLWMQLREKSVSLFYKTAKYVKSKIKKQ